MKDSPSFSFFDVPGTISLLIPVLSEGGS